MKQLAIEGINGSGKTPALVIAKDLLANAGISSDTYAAYHLVRDKIEEPDSFDLWADRPEQAVALLHETLNEIEADARARNLDVLLFDRHWLTAYTQAETNPEIITMWGDRHVPTVLFTSPSHHLTRLAERGYPHEWLQAESLEYYRQLYDQLYERYAKHFLGRFTVASSTQDLAPIAHQLVTLIKTMEE